jgi:hypothetical protein
MIDTKSFSKIRESIALALHGIADNTVGADVLRANVRDLVRSLFPALPSEVSIAASMPAGTSAEDIGVAVAQARSAWLASRDTVLKSAEWTHIVDDARAVFGEAFFKAPRMAGGKPVDLDAARVAYTATDAKSLPKPDKALRKAVQDYVRVAVRQNVTSLVPELPDTGKVDGTTDDAAEGTGEATKAAPTPDAILAGLDAFLASNPAADLVNNLFDQFNKRQRDYKKATK